MEGLVATVADAQVIIVRCVARVATAADRLQSLGAEIFGDQGPIEGHFRLSAAPWSTAPLGNGARRRRRRQLRSSSLSFLLLLRNSLSRRRKARRSSSLRPSSARPSWPQAVRGWLGGGRPGPAPTPSLLGCRRWPLSRHSCHRRGHGCRRCRGRGCCRSWHRGRRQWSRGLWGWHCKWGCCYGSYLRDWRCRWGSSGCRRRGLLEELALQPRCWRLRLLLQGRRLSSRRWSTTAATDRRAVGEERGPSAIRCED
mmetsp:Transcript_65147/g.143881  ORF Transcript_65147/g.143881 Transcript_65147/m.143881 type:complete len:255 (-) Transcript_65147:110-874(-)